MAGRPFHIGHRISVARPFSSTMVLVRLSRREMVSRAAMSSTRSPQQVAVFTKAEAAKAVAGPLALKERLGDDHAQPSARLQIAVGSGVEHEHGEVLLRSAVPGLIGRKRKQAVMLPSGLVAAR